MEGANNDGRCHEPRPEFDEFDIPEAALLPRLLIFMNDRGYYKNDVMPVVANVWRAVDPKAVDRDDEIAAHDSHAQQPVRKQRGLHFAEALREYVEGSSTQSVAVLVQSPMLSCHYACVVFESRTNRGFIFDPLHRAAMIADASAVLRALFELMRCTGYIRTHTASRMPRLEVSDQHLCVYAALDAKPWTAVLRDPTRPSFRWLRTSRAIFDPRDKTDLRDSVLFAVYRRR